MKEVVEELKVVNDLVRESKEELTEKYLKSEEVYSEFLRKFTKFFASRRMFQLRFSRQYNKILNLVQEGNKRYNSEENQANLETLSSEIKMSSKYRVDDHDFRDAEESISLFKNSIGLDAVNRVFSYADSIDMITKAGEKYLVARDREAIKQFAKDLYSEIKKSSSLQNAKQLVQGSLDDETRSVLELCNNEEFLLFANYSINFSKNIDGNFIEDVQNIINLSRILQTIGVEKEGFKKENYNRLVEFTNKSLKKYAKEKEKQDKLVLRKAKKLAF